jgi:hypothetical protein
MGTPPLIAMPRPLPRRLHAPTLKQGNGRTNGRTVVATTEKDRQTGRKTLRRQNAKPVAGSFSSAYKERDCRPGTKNSGNQGELGFQLFARVAKGYSTKAY